MTKRVLSGVVVSDKNDKTVVVKVKRKYIHPFFKKVISSSKKYHAHDEKNEFKNGDNIKIVESKPYSKNKQWKVFSK
ncbi:MAG: 30S ribosomal protein S17 [Candidatus Pelagibacter sp. TMED64]|nr:30S ribosomal protein S17 [Candidatus Pelagibacter sp.]OUU67085.1 MAG: 30S ribosomal protein S17 [Candidatus Pelagibacter sp. TMED64]|tara:strand:- start:159 stop:389 length:231 start_codon:yes stop_codon:yes gene_type:complete